LTDIEIIIEEKINVENLEAIEDNFVVLRQLNIPSSPCVPSVASSSLDGGPYTFDAPNAEDEKYEDAYAGDSDEDHHVPNVVEDGSDAMYEEELDEGPPVPKFFEKETDAYVKVFGRHPIVFMSSRMLGRLTKPWHTLTCGNMARSYLGPSLRMKKKNNQGHNL
jgi:hypothetical protein